VCLALATAGLSRAAGASIRVIARLTPERMRRERWTEEFSPMLCCWVGAR